jgi:hypothetical protein
MSGTGEHPWPPWSSIPDDQKPVWAREVGGAALDKALSDGRARHAAFEAEHGRRPTCEEATAMARAAKGLPT